MPLYSLHGQAPDLPPPGQFHLAETAVLIGKVRLKPGASVWFGAVLRGDNEWIEIGERSNIQDNCVLHTDPGYPINVGSGCTVGHGAILHGCTIGNNSLVGMGAIVLNGATVGVNCLIGAGALVPERMVVPDNALVVGAPARKIRDINEAAAKMIGGAADNYYSRWRAYASGLTRIA